MEGVLGRREGNAMFFFFLVPACHAQPVPVCPISNPTNVTTTKHPPTVPPPVSNINTERMERLSLLAIRGRQAEEERQESAENAGRRAG